MSSSGNNIFSLDGLHEKPFYLRPEDYDLAVYPAEWYGDATFDPVLVGELSDIFYTRPFGRHIICNLWTLFSRPSFLSWFEADVTLGYRNLLSDAPPGELPRVYFNDGFSLLQSAALKEFMTETDSFRQTLEEGYTAIPLFPAPLAVGVVTRFNLGEGYDAGRISVLLSELNNFLG